jgi:DNA topoisomerase VI subunit B
MTKPPKFVPQPDGVDMNDFIATQVENVAGEDRAQFLMAHMIRKGHLDQRKELRQYACENKCSTQDYIEAIIEAAARDVIQVGHRSDQTEVEKIVEALGEMFKRALIICWVSCDLADKILRKDDE